MLTPPGDAAALAGALVELAADPARVRDLGTAIAARFDRRFAPRAIGAELRRSC